MPVQIVDEIRPTLVPGRHPFMTGPFAPNYVEVDATELEVIGRVPERLAGVYLRNTQNPVLVQSTATGNGSQNFCYFTP